MDNNTIHNNGKAGIGFDSADIDPLYGDPVEASSQPVAITRNDIYSNAQGGIGILDAITGAVTISENNIYQNTLGGIGIQNACTLSITRNSIYDNLRGGIHTGTDVAGGAGFSGASGSADLTIRQNKIYRNGHTEYGAGIDVRHASGVIYNNLVYKNYMGGVRFGDHITEIVNNTVAANGQSISGGGIVYNDLAGAVNDPPSGSIKDSLNYPDPLIRNNISTHNATAGLRVGNMPTGTTEDCPDNPDYDGFGAYRDFNLLYFNNETDDHCGWPGPYGELNDQICVSANYAGCGFADEELSLRNPHDVIADPLFVGMDTDDFHLQNASPAKNAGDDRTDMGAYGGSNPIDW
jgi:hypothetical protein